MADGFHRSLEAHWHERLKKIAQQKPDKPE
jgi:hypothetical protein